MDVELSITHPCSLLIELNLPPIYLPSLFLDDWPSFMWFALVYLTLSCISCNADY